VGKHLLCDFYKLTVHAKELKDQLENMDKKMPYGYGSSHRAVKNGTLFVFNFITKCWVL
jgi:hypothetical protein